MRTEKGESKEGSGPRQLKDSMYTNANKQGKQKKEDGAQKIL